MSRSRLNLRVMIATSVALTTCAADPPAVDPNLAEAIRWYTGVSGRVDNEQARALLLQAASDGDAVSRMWIARVYSRGRMGFEENVDSARTIAHAAMAGVEAAAEQGGAEAAFLMGTAYAEGLGKDQNDEVAVDWYRRAADMGNVLAQHNMGNVYFSGTGVQQNDSLAAHWWAKAASQGDAIPQFRLGTMYEQGRGVARDLDQARRWYEESASRGYSDAVEALALLRN